MERDSLNTTISNLTTENESLAASRDTALTTLYGDDMTDDGVGGFAQEVSDLTIERDDFEEDADLLGDFITDYGLDLEFESWTPPR